MTQLPQSKPTPLEIRQGVCIEDQNLWIWELFDQFKKDLKGITDPLFTYLSKYSQYKEFLLFDVEKELQRIQKDQNKDIK